MNPALDDLLRDWTDYMAKNRAAAAAYRRKVTGGDRCQFCSGRFIYRDRHEAVCRHRPGAGAS